MVRLVGGQLRSTQTLDPATIPSCCRRHLEPAASDTVTRALGTESGGFVQNITQRIAEADVVVDDRGDGRSTRSPSTPSWSRSASRRPPRSSARPISASSQIRINDRYYSATASGGPERVITATLSNPYTDRAQTVQTIASVMLTAALLALLVAIVAAILLAQWLTQPIRRLTQASRVAGGGPSWIPACRCPRARRPRWRNWHAPSTTWPIGSQESIRLVSGDRDRSRDFLADVSHELRTPIAALRTFNELLRDGAAADPATREEFLEQSARQIERLDWLSTNLLELSKLDSGLVALDLRPDDLRAVVENAVEQAATTREAQGPGPDRPPSSGAGAPAARPTAQSARSSRT